MTPKELDSLVMQQMGHSTCPNYYDYLTALAFVLQPAVVVELGTNYGGGTNALAKGCEAIVHTYDVVERELSTNSPQIRPHIHNFLLSQSPEHEAILASADLIFLDVDPHDGAQEWDFIQLFLRLLPPGKEVWLAMDDIQLNSGMARFFTTLATVPQIESLAVFPAHAYLPGFGLSRICV
jgi:predicted O-methyltransferase YrrM